MGSPDAYDKVASAKKTKAAMLIMSLVSVGFMVVKNVQNGRLSNTAPLILLNSECQTLAIAVKSAKNCIVLTNFTFIPISLE